jgi:hypothetical protein
MTEDQKKADGQEWARLIRAAARKLHKGMKSGGPLPSKKSKSKRRGDKHPQRAKADW